MALSADAARSWFVDDAGFEELVIEHRSWLVGFCERRLAGDAHRAEDVAQEALVRLRHALEDGHDIANVRGWLGTVAANIAVDELRRTTRLVLVDPPDRPVVDGHDGPADPHLDVAWQTLSSRHRHVLRLRELEGLRYDEIARTMVTTVAAVETLLFRARAALRREYTRAGGQLAALGSVERAVRTVAEGPAASLPAADVAGTALGPRSGAVIELWNRLATTAGGVLARLGEAPAAAAVVAAGLLGLGAAPGADVPPLPAAVGVEVDVAVPAAPDVDTGSLPEAQTGDTVDGDPAPPAGAADAEEAAGDTDRRRRRLAQVVEHGVDGLEAAFDDITTVAVALEDVVGRVVEPIRRR